MYANTEQVRAHPIVGTSYEEEKQSLQEKIAPILDLRSQCKGKTTVIIGDIHECFDEFSELLDSINWSPQTHVVILTGDLVDRGPKIKECLQFAMTTPNLYSLMSNHEWKLFRYLNGRPVKKHTLAKTIEQCGEPFLRDPLFVGWLQSLPYIIRWSDDSYAVHAGIRPDRPISRQNKDHCMFIRTWNPKTGSIRNEGADPWWFEYPYLSGRRSRQSHHHHHHHHHHRQISIFFGHQRHDKAWVSSWACALDAGVVFGGALRSYVQHKGIVEVNAKKIYERDEDLTEET